MIDTLIVHIGDGKCGSTSIQAALYEDRETLSSMGIGYDALQAAGGQSRLALLAGTKMRKPAAALGQTIEQQKEFLPRLTRLAENHRTVVFSGETFLRSDPKKIMGLLLDTVSGARKVHVIAYIRHPVDAYLSESQQRLKRVALFKSPFAEPRIVDKFLEGWSKQEGLASMTVRPFRRDAFPNGSVVSDFSTFLNNCLGRTDIELKDRFDNSALSAEQLVLLQQVHRTFDDQRAPTAALKYFLLMNENGPVGSPIRLGHTARQILMHSRQPLIDRLNGLFPALAFASGDSDKLPSEWAQRDWSDVATVLDKVDPDILADLTLLTFPDKSDPGKATAAQSEALARLAGSNPGCLAQLTTATQRYWSDLGRKTKGNADR